MKKNLLVALMVVILVCTCALVFTACGKGTYTNGDSTIKLGAFSKVEVHMSYLGISYDFEGKYELGDKDDDGNRTVNITYEKEDGTDGSFPAAYIDKDNNLWVAGVLKFTK